MPDEGGTSHTSTSESVKNRVSTPDPAPNLAGLTDFGKADWRLTQAG